MKKITILLLAVSVGLLAYDLPKNWHRAGSQPDKYEMGIDKGAGPDGKNVATIKSVSMAITGYGSLMQNSLPGKYLGKRVRMSGFMKSENVTSWAGFWFRVDQAESSKRLAFDNMKRRPVRGNTNWQHYEIVLDVPANAANLAFGALIYGTGQIWFDNINFEIVDSTVNTTGENLAPVQEPQNLTFDDADTTQPSRLASMQMPSPAYSIKEYLVDNLHYPKHARDKHREGRVVVRFVVNKDGSITDCEVVKGINKDCDKEALRVVQNMPPWKPGIKDGVPVKVYYALPIVFKIQ